MSYNIEKASKQTAKLVLNPKPIKAPKKQKVKTPKYFKKVFREMKSDLAR